MDKKQDSPKKQEAISNINAFKSQLAEDSPTLAYLEYFLRLSLFGATARIEGAWEVSNPQLTLAFDKKSRGLLTVDAWIPVKNLQSAEGNVEEDIIRRGFHVPPEGLHVQVGRVPPPKSSTNELSSVDGQTVPAMDHEHYFLAKVVLGRSYNASLEAIAQMTLPEGYDSFIVEKGDPEGDSKSVEYVIKDAGHILPAFLTIVHWDPEEETRSRQRVTCENCDLKPATVYCKADAASLCQECDVKLHTSSKLAGKHQRVALSGGQGLTIATPCRTHPDHLVEFFAPRAPSLFV